MTAEAVSTIVLRKLGAFLRELSSGIWHTTSFWLTSMYQNALKPKSLQVFWLTCIYTLALNLTFLHNYVVYAKYL